MAKLNYRTPATRPPSGDGPSEVTAPLVLLGLGLVIYLIWATAMFGVSSALLIMGIVCVLSAVETLLGVGAAFVTASLLSTSFGDLRSAFLKFAGVVVLCGSLSAAIPYGRLLVLFVYLGLLMWLFSLEMYEAVVFALVFWGIRILAAIAFAGMVSGMLRGM